LYYVVKAVKDLRKNEVAVTIAIVSLVLCSMVAQVYPSAQADSVTLPSIGHVITVGGMILEYGAESGVLQPPWDRAGPSGGGDSSGVGCEISTEHVRTGLYSVRIYQPSPPKSENQRRVGLYYWSHDKYEHYFSWWMYFPSGYDDVVAAAGWLTIGGYCLYWNKIGGVPYEDYIGLRARFFVGKDSEGFWVRMTWSKIDSGVTQFWKEGPKRYLALNQWHHFQIYMKNDRTVGQITAWINNAESGSWSEPTHPEAHGYQGGEYWSEHDRYTMIIQQYCDQDAPQLEVWVDDVVGSTEKV